MAAVVSVETAAELKTGMEVQVSPSTADRETYGYMKGRIERIGEFPVSEEEGHQPGQEQRIGRLSDAGLSRHSGDYFL